MQIRSIADLLAELEPFTRLQDADRELVAGCARNEIVEDGVELARDGEPADRFFVVRSGRLAVAVHGPSRSLVVDTAGPGEVVGWSWIFPPYRWTADVHAVGQTRILVVDGACLRDKCESDPAFGYRVMKSFARVVAHRLEATHLRLLDLYGDA